MEFKKIKAKSLSLVLNFIPPEVYFKLFKRTWIGEARHIYIACLPKSGSTFIANTIRYITDFDFTQYQRIRGTNDHNIDESVFLSNLNKNTVTQLHTKPNDWNIKFFEGYNLKVVFLSRRITHSLISMRNHLLNENNRWFMFSYTEDFENWTYERQIDFLIDLILPWYIDFLVSWKREIPNKRVKILEVRYEDFKKDNLGTLKQILDFYKIDVDEESIVNGLKHSYRRKEKLRYNSKESNKHYTFSERQLDKINQMLNYYPEISFDI